MGPDQEERTRVAGVHLADEQCAAPGDVVGERYEVRKLLFEDPVMQAFEAFDQETEREVLLRIVRNDLFDEESERRDTVRRLREVVGYGGTYLAGLLDADRDRTHVFVVEPMPSGRFLLDAVATRRRQGKPFGTKHLLPVVASIAAALEAIPPGKRHGDVRPSNVFIGDKVELRGAFLMAALPRRLVVTVLQGDEGLRRRVAPEVLAGQAGAPSDRYGVAAIVLEALSGDAPEPGAPVAEALGEIGKALGALLHPDPTRRATSFAPLLQAMARKDGSPIPRLDPGAFVPKEPSRGPQGLDEAWDEITDADPPPQREAVEEEHTRRVVLKDVVPSPGRAAKNGPDTDKHLAPPARRSSRPPRKIEGAAPEGTQQVSIDQIIEMRPADEADAPPPKTEGTQQISIDQIMEVAPISRPAPAHASLAEPVIPRPAAVPSEMSLDAEIDPAEFDEPTTTAAPVFPPPPASPDPMPVAPMPQPQQRKRPPKPRPVFDMAQLTQDIKPIPRARLRDSVPPAKAPAPALFDDTRDPFDSAPTMAYDIAVVEGELPAVTVDPVFAGAPSGMPPTPGPVQPAAAPPSREANRPTMPIPRAALGAGALPKSGEMSLKPPQKKKRKGGWWVVLGAIVVAGGIVTVSLWYSRRQRAIEEEQRERRLQERFEAIQRFERTEENEGE